MVVYQELIHLEQDWGSTRTSPNKAIGRTLISVFLQVDLYRFFGTPAPAASALARQQVLTFISIRPYKVL